MIRRITWGAAGRLRLLVARVGKRQRLRLFGLVVWRLLQIVRDNGILCSSRDLCAALLSTNSQLHATDVLPHRVREHACRRIPADDFVRSVQRLSDDGNAAGNVVRHATAVGAVYDLSPSGHRELRSVTVPERLCSGGDGGLLRTKRDHSGSSCGAGVLQWKLGLDDHVGLRSAGCARHNNTQLVATSSIRFGTDSHARVSIATNDRGPVAGANDFPTKSDVCSQLARQR